MVLTPRIMFSVLRSYGIEILEQVVIFTSWSHQHKNFRRGEDLICNLRLTRHSIAFKSDKSKLLSNGEGGLVHCGSALGRCRHSLPAGSGTLLAMFPTSSATALDEIGAARLSEAGDRVQPSRDDIRLHADSRRLRHARRGAAHDGSFFPKECPELSSRDGLRQVGPSLFRPRWRRKPLVASISSILVLSRA